MQHLHINARSAFCWCVMTQPTFVALNTRCKIDTTVWWTEIILGFLPQSHIQNVQNAAKCVFLNKESLEHPSVKCGYCLQAYLWLDLQIRASSVKERQITKAVRSILTQFVWSKDEEVVTEHEWQSVTEAEQTAALLRGDTYSAHCCVFNFTMFVSVQVRVRWGEDSECEAMGCTSAKQVSAVPNDEEGRGKAYSNGDLFTGQSTHTHVNKILTTPFHSVNCSVQTHRPVCPHSILSSL